jgi:D-glycerate 3-kinase
VRVPRFDKAADDRVPEPAWPGVRGPLDIVLLEGVLVGVPPEADPDPESGTVLQSCIRPINDFERERDPDGRLRRHANAQLGELHRALDPLLDVRVFLAVPDLASVLAWRSEQERALGSDAAGQPLGMDSSTLARFVARFERLTLHALRTAPALADLTLELDAEHRVSRVAFTPRAAAEAAR